MISLRLLSVGTAAARIVLMLANRWSMRFQLDRQRRPSDAGVCPQAVSHWEYNWKGSKRPTGTVRSTMPSDVLIG